MFSGPYFLKLEKKNQQIHLEQKTWKLELYNL